MKKIKLGIDADYLIFECTEGRHLQDNIFENESVDMKPLKEKFKALVRDIEDEVAVELLGKVKLGKTKLFFSDPDGNFRYGLYPDYKSGRKSKRSKEFYKLRKWALKKYGYVKGTEADDVIAHYVRDKGWVGASFDKDLLRGVEGIWFDVYHSRRHIVETSPRQAQEFNLIQTLTGDPTDSIPGLPRVAEKTAIKLLDKYGWSWVGVIEIYKSKGMTEKDAILTRRLVCMRQYTKKKGVKLWKPTK